MPQDGGSSTDPPVRADTGPQQPNRCSSGANLGQPPVVRASALLTAWRVTYNTTQRAYDALLPILRTCAAELCQLRPRDYMDAAFGLHDLPTPLSRACCTACHALHDTSAMVGRSNLQRIRCNEVSA